ncbi:MAG: winged helix-turn-helix domain-containing protein, partial [Myxococcota bacterium]
MQVHRIGTWHFVPATRELRAGNEQRRLTELEGRLLEYLCVRPSQIVSPTELLREVWEYAPGVESRAVTHTVGRLRKKLGAEGRRLSTVHGQGYRLDLPNEGGLFGRGAELARVRDTLETDGLVTLYGIGGVGKSAIAKVVAEGYATLWLPASALTASQDVLAVLSTMLGVEGRVTPAVVGR